MECFVFVLARLLESAVAVFVCGVACILGTFLDLDVRC